MRKYCEENERIKRQFLTYLKNAKGQDQKSLDKVAAALIKFERSTKFKSFKRFHIEQAGTFKTYLDGLKNRKTGKPLSLATNDATLRMVKEFFRWLAGQPGYKSRISYADVEYFNNNAKNARAAHAERDIPYPSIEAALCAFRAMPDGTEIEQRNRAIFALLMLTGARVGAVASFRLKHVDLFNGCVNQDGREVNTKNSKSYVTYFFPVDPDYLKCFSDWVNYLREQKIFSPEDALFPKPEMGIGDNGGFVVIGLSRENYSVRTKINLVVRQAFARQHMPEFTPHSFRKTLAFLGDEICTTMEQRKAWSMNLGHENIATTVSAYLPIPQQRRKELILGMQKSAG